MNTVTATPDRVSLYYREGSSDKVYQAAIKPADGSFVVNFAYGRRGATLTTGTKTSTPVDYDTAKKIYTKLVGEKKAKGYTEGADGTPYQHTDKRVSGILPQLLNPIEESDVERLLSDDDYCAQEIVANMPQRPVIKHGMTAAYYSPTDDSIAMPDRNRFETEDHYHATLFHELVHATGHEKRLKRAGIMERNGYGSKPYGNMAKGWRKGRDLNPR